MSERPQAVFSNDDDSRGSNPAKQTVPRIDGNGLHQILMLGKDGYVLREDAPGNSFSDESLAKGILRLNSNGYSQGHSDESVLYEDDPDASFSAAEIAEEMRRLNSDGYSDEYSDESVLREDAPGNSFSDESLAKGVFKLNSNGYSQGYSDGSVLREDAPDNSSSDESLAEDDIKAASDLDITQENITAADWKKYVWPALHTGVLPVLSLLSSISTMYAAQDVVLEVLTAMGYTLDDIDSIGEDEKTLSQLLANIAAKGVLWGIPMITIIANSVMRYFGAIKAKDFFEKLVKENSLKAYLWFVVYLALATQTAISDTLINVLTSDKLKEVWLPIFIKSEALLSVIFLLPLNIYFISLLHQRLQCDWDKYSKGDDRKLFSKRLEVIFYELRKLPPDEQAAKLRELYGDTDSINDGLLPTTYDELMALSQEQLEQLAETICKNANLPDGNSWGSTAATAVTAVFALLAGAAIMRSPYVFYTVTCEFASAAAWCLSDVSGLTKSAMYLGSYDNLMWCAKNYSRLFGSAPFLYGASAVLLSLSAAGFWEVGQRALAVVFEKVAADPTWWFKLLNMMIYSGGVAANTSSAASLAVEKGEEKRRSELGLNETPDLAMGFKELANRALNPPKERIADEEGLQDGLIEESAPYRGSYADARDTDVRDTDEESREAWLDKEFKNAGGWLHMRNITGLEEMWEQKQKRKASKVTEATPLSGASSASEHSSQASWCTFFSECVHSITPRSVSDAVHRVCAPCFN